MKKLMVILLIYILNVAYAKINQQDSIAQLINKVKSSSGDSRRIAMNKLKIALRSLNLKSRNKIIITLRNSLNVKISKNNTYNNLSYNSNSKINQQSKGIGNNKCSKNLKANHGNKIKIKSKPNRPKSNIRKKGMKSHTGRGKH